MADPKFPYVNWRGGRPRSKHGPRQRERGFIDQDLKHPDGRWFTMEEASKWSDQRVLDIAVAKNAGKRKAQPPRKRTTVAHLLEDWQASDEFKALSVAARDSYAKCVTAILYQPESREAAVQRRAQIRAAKVLGLAEPSRELEPMATATPSSIGQPELRAFFNYLKDARGHHMAIAVIATLSAAMTWGRQSTLWRLGPNPRTGMVFERPDGRVVLVTMSEFLAWVAAADAIDRPSLGDCLYLALFTGQRQTDRLMMRNESAVEGRHAFRQSKTGEIVDIKEAPQLTARLNASRARVKQIKLRMGLETIPPELVVNEDNGKAYDESTYRHWVATARALAVFGFLRRDTPRQAIARAERLAAELNKISAKLFAPFPIGDDQHKAMQARARDERGRALSDWMSAQAMRDSNGDQSAWQLQPCPSLIFINAAGDLDQKHDQDLRDTCVMLLDRGGCDLLTICDISGHSYKSAQTIVKHYRARNADRADAGIDRLELQVRKEGMA